MKRLVWLLFVLMPIIGFAQKTVYSGNFLCHLATPSGWCRVA